MPCSHIGGHDDLIMSYDNFVLDLSSPVNLINNTDCDKNIEIKIDVALFDSRGQAESISVA